MVTDRPVRVGIIGCGEIARHHARIIVGNPNPPAPPVPHEGLKARVKRWLRGRPAPQPIKPQPVPPLGCLELIACTDSDPHIAAAFARDFGITQVCNDAVGLLARGDIDAVLICTPPATHAEHTVAATRHNKHVFCEKPMALTVADCERMVEATRTAGVVLQIGYVLRFSHERGRIRDAVLAGELGRPVFWREIYSPRSGPGQRWVHDAAHGGGVFFENSHAVDFLRTVFGEPVDVQAVATHAKPDRTDVPDSVAYLLTFAGGDRALFTDSYGLPGFGWEDVGERPNFLMLDVLGPRGAVQFPDGRQRQNLVVRRYADGPVTPVQIPWQTEWGADGYQAELEHFAACVRTGQPCAASGEDALRTVALVHRLRAAAGVGADASTAAKRVAVGSA